MSSSSEEESDSDEEEDSSNPVSAAVTPAVTSAAEQHVDLLNLGTATPTQSAPTGSTTSAPSQQGSFFDLMSGSGEQTQPDITVNSNAGAFADFSEFAAPPMAASNGHAAPTPHTNGNMDLLGGFDSMPGMSGSSSNILQPGQASSHASSSSLVDQDFMNFMGSQSGAGMAGHALSTENILNTNSDAGMTRPASFANQPHLNTGLSQS